MEKLFKNDEITERLDNLLKTSGISKYKLSKLTNISQAQISGYFNQKRNWTYRTLKIISEVLKVDFDSLAFGESYKIPNLDDISKRINGLISAHNISHYKLCKDLNIGATTFSANIRNQSKWSDLKGNELNVYNDKANRVETIPLNTACLEVFNMKVKSIDRIFPYRSEFISKSFKKLLRSLNFDESYHFHCLRHTFITNLVNRGTHFDIVKKLARHSNIQTTLGYIHTTSDELRKAVESL